MKLKEYQKATLATLRTFLEESRISGPKAAYEAITAEPDLAVRIRGYAAGYKPIKALPDVPYVCLRLPTGGGKTILAAHSITVAKDAWVEKDFPLVLWLVPTNTIRLQTAEALKNPRHSYRKVLDEAFEGRVRVIDICDFTQLTPHDMRSNLCVVVGTIQALRQSKTDKYHVYRHHEMLESHFSTVSPNAPGLERNDDGQNKGDIRFSFANLLHLHRPLVIMDEAHKAGSDLSQIVYERINPTALIEFTATPKGFNNILYSVSAQELKVEEMIKMPVVLDEADTWQGAVNSAILKRTELQEWADKDREGYIRPIVLFQAQKKNDEVTVEVLKQHLIDNEGIDPSKIAVATGAQRELDNIDLFKPDCLIEYVITIEALKEGWDCSFAYVFCSVANICSSTDAEQLLGRVLRMPYAKRRKTAALNKSYAKLVSKRFAEAANSLRDKLVDMGFEEGEADANVEAEQLDLLGGILGWQARPHPTLTVEVEVTADEAKGIERVAPGKITVAPDASGKVSVQIKGFLKPREKEELYALSPERFHDTFRNKINEWEEMYAHEVAPAHRGETFTVPRLMTYVQQEFVWGDTDLLMEYHDWSLADQPARLGRDEFDIVETMNTFEIDLDGNRLLIVARDSSEQLTLDIDVEDWTPAKLVQWLDRKVRDPWISQVEMLAWIGDVVTHLTRDHGLPLAQLMRCKFILARKLGEKIKGFRQMERDKAYQLSFFGPEARLEVSFDDGFEFFDEMYADVPKYRSTNYAFVNHFMGPDEVPVFDGTEGGEEEQCALVIDGLSGMKYWTRNVSRHPNSFFLPTSTDKFYPDFVARMDDRRLLVVEYKGADRTAKESRDTREKDLIGKTWAQASRGKAVFVIATIEKRDPLSARRQIASALAR